jgi:hypothetical protein
MIGAVVLLATLHALGDESKSAEPKQKSPSQIQEEDRARLRDLSKRFDVLYRQGEHELNELIRQHETRRVAERRRRVATGRAREDLEVEVDLQNDIVGLQFFNWYAKISALIDLDRRIWELKSLLNSREEIQKLNGLRDRKLAELRELEKKLDVNRSELIQAKKITVILQIVLDTQMGPQGRMSVALRALTKKAQDASETKWEIDEGKVKEARENLDKANKKAAALRSDMKQLWDRMAQVRDEVLEIDVSLWRLNEDVSFLEKSRIKWDTERNGQN